MNIRDLVYVQAIARTEHFGRAAESCHVSQPALSSQIKKLEAELGVTLFERDNRSVRLTHMGERLLPLIDDALSSIDNIRMAAETARNPYAGNFKLGAIPTVAPYLIPHFVRQSGEVLPGLHLTFTEDITERLNKALLTGELDAAILATPPENPKLEVLNLYDEAFWVIFPNEHVLRMLKKIKTKDLPLDELLLLSEGHCFRDQAMDVCQLGSGPQARSIRATSLETLINMVSAGQGITLVPAMAISRGWRSDSSVQIQKLEDPVACRRICLTFRKSYPRRNLIEKLVDLISQNLPGEVSRLR